jgi:steroid delta-isomerase-like uncharacterized protein
MPPSSVAPTTSHADIVRRFIEDFQTGHDVNVALELLAEDCVNQTPVAPYPADRDGVISMFVALFEAFPDLHVEIHDLLESGDKVVTRKTFHGRHDGEFLGLAPTGRTVSWDVIDIVRFRGGQMVEHWAVIDIFGLFMQLGAIPSPD